MSTTRSGLVVVCGLFGRAVTDAFPEVRSVWLASSVVRQLSAQPAPAHTHHSLPRTQDYNPLSLYPTLLRPNRKDLEAVTSIVQPNNLQDISAHLAIDDPTDFAYTEFTEADFLENEFTTHTDVDSGVSLVASRELGTLKHAKDIAGVRARSPENVDLEKLRDLYNRQLDLELKSKQAAIDRYEDAFKESGQSARGGAPILGSKQLVNQWLPHVTTAVQQEQEAVLKGESGKQRVVYGPYLMVLDAEELAHIAIQGTLAMSLLPSRNGQTEKLTGRAPVTHIACTIGKKVNERVNMLQLHKKVQEFRDVRKREGKSPDVDDPTWAKFSNGEAAKMFTAERLLQRLSKNSPSRYFQQHRRHLDKASTLLLQHHQWPPNVQALVGGKLLEMVVTSAKVWNPSSRKWEAAFNHGQQRMADHRRKQGYVEVSERAVKHLQQAREAMALLQPDYNPMVVEPRPWSGVHSGGYLTLRSSIVRNKHSRLLMRRVSQAAAKGELNLLYDALNALGNTPWVINRGVYEVMKEVWQQGGGVASVPLSKEYTKPPPLNNNPGFRLVVEQGQLICTGMPPVSTEVRRHRFAVNEVTKKNRELASVRATFMQRLRIADMMVEEEAIYYPHNIDFRGRAYPVHPYLNHLGDDVCRGLLKFSEAKALGRDGLDWLYVQVANVWGQGVDKLSFDNRKRFTRDNLANVLDSATSPLTGRRWWLGAEKPWQCLATCLEIKAALASGKPEEFLSQLPVHMDGSCNGLQHYAALGRDDAGGRAVNLMPADVPQDVYQGVADIVSRRVEEDAALGRSEALLIQGSVNRKLVKQTVMTSVYGVTFVGARDQIASRLKERGWQSNVEIFKVSRYLAKLTLDSIGELFNSAREIMRWLGDCAEVIGTTNQPVMWTTPIGVPVLQPYHQLKARSVDAPLQSMSLQSPDDTPGTKVARRRQRTAFPPNYIHCLDSAHMMMTALACRELGLSFAGVHDSYWTHAGTVRQMNRMLRHMFVELHSQPLLEELLDAFKAQYPEVAGRFPRIPKRGTMKLSDVHKSKYFFS